MGKLVGKHTCASCTVFSSFLQTRLEVDGVQSCGLNPGCSFLFFYPWTAFEDVVRAFFLFFFGLMKDRETDLNTKCRQGRELEKESLNQVGGKLAMPFIMTISPILESAALSLSSLFSAFYNDSFCLIGKIFTLAFFLCLCGNGDKKYQWLSWFC